MGCVVPLYRPRDAEHTVLHQVIGEHLETFLNAVAEAGDGAGLPQFVEREFREFLLCGVFEAGVVPRATSRYDASSLSTLRDRRCLVTNAVRRGDGSLPV